jgi:hypothetical protein
MNARPLVVTAGHQDNETTTNQIIMTPMNRFQSAIVLVAAANIVLMLLFPPHLNNPLSLHAAKGFDGFYFVLSAAQGKTIHTELLTMEVFFVVANTLAAWLALSSEGKRRRRPLTETDIAAGILAFAVVDFAIVGLFPPFEAYQSMVRVPPVGFDGFHFILGGKMHRPIYAPMLYLECLLLAADFLVAWLVLSGVCRRLADVDEALLEIVHHLPPEKLAVVEEVIRRELAAEAPPPEPVAVHVEIGRHGERRHHVDTKFPGPERRNGDRRHHS